ncbi:hypothetical protein V1514DRAFT_329992 [Lipomyces japonicus]|uniref:uncharacterized protein n=1 Tax=Lipomyces japonicus TaxID=56871 RepID=UPI0034CE1A08
MVGINSPIPSSLKSECKKAARILTSFIKPNQVLGMDTIIPPSVLANAKGLAIITVLKAGFLFSGRAGSGIVIARLPDGSWSAPSALITAGAGVGGQIGAELTDFVMILNTRAAVESFSQLGSITLGGNISVAAGPIGRNVEAGGSASLKSVAAIFSYSKTRGLFAGVSLEGSALVERRDANRKFYGGSVTAKQLLSGTVEPPPGADPLLRVLESRVFRGNFESVYDDDIYNDIPTYGDDDDDSSIDSGDRRYGGRSGGGGGSGRARNGSYSNSSRRRYDDYDDRDENSSWNSRQGGYDRESKKSSWEDDVYDHGGRASRGVRESDSNRKFQRQHFESTYSDKPSRPTGPKPNYNDSDYNEPDYRRSSGRNDPSSRGSGGGSSRGSYGDSEPRRPKGIQAVALYTFEGEQSGDLGFRKGDIISIVKKSESRDDWWTGRKDSKEGIFPANYVELM